MVRIGVTQYQAGKAWDAYHGRLLRASILAFGAVLALPLSAGAQNAKESTQLEKITLEGESARGPDKGIVAKQSTSASKTNTPLKETPQAVSVVTRDQMKAQGVDSVADALRYTPGVLPDPNGFDVRYDWLYIRGFNAYGTTWLDGLVMPGATGAVEAAEFASDGRKVGKVVNVSAASGDARAINAALTAAGKDALVLASGDITLGQTLQLGTGKGLSFDAQAWSLLRLLPKCGGNDHSGHRELPRPLGGGRRGHRFTSGSRQRTARPIREHHP